jgi:hypothetical protein
MNPLEFLNTIKGYGAKAAPRVFQGAIDTVTDPRTYQRLAKDAEKLLGRNLPPQFSGANFGNIPTRATGLINDLVETSGVQRAVQGGMTSRAIQEMAGIAPRLARTATQTAEGLLRAPSIGQGLTRQITTRLPEAAQALDPFARDYGLTRELMKRAGGGMQDVAESLLPKQAFNPVGGVGGLIQNLNKVTTPMGAVKTGLNIGGPLVGLIDLAQTAYKGSVQQNQLGGLLSPAGAAYGAARMLTGGPFSLLPSIVDDMDKIMPRTSDKDLLQEYANIKARDQEFNTNRTDAGRYIPGNQQKPIFVKQADAPPRPDLPPADPGLTQAGTLNTGAGTQDQRRAIEERNYKTQLNNAKQQYATPDPMSPDFQGYPNELAARYGLEQAYGQELRQAGTLVPQLQEAGAGAGMTPENFAAWAKANPGLAVRLLSQGQRN